MNTRARGNSFENKVLKYFEEELKKERLHVPRTSKLFPKKGSFSKDRNSDIIVDLAIETWMPDAKNYSLLTIIECKAYTHPVPVNDIEEFHAKVQQITGDNVKAIFVTNSSLQKGALEFAKSKQMGLVRFLPDDQVKWEIHYIIGELKPERLDPYDFNSAFLNQGHISKRGNFYGRDEKYIYGSLFSILDSYLNK